jgi:phosphoribosylaminoimidazolecarboxamide formyltransferase / IMP cyclohydrolase
MGGARVSHELRHAVSPGTPRAVPIILKPLECIVTPKMATAHSPEPDQVAYSLAGTRYMTLLHGENMYQKPAFLYAACEGDDSLSLCGFKQLAGEKPCFTNIADMDCILETLCRLDSALRKHDAAGYIALGAKHGNACGLGVSVSDPAAALTKALWGNPRALWGGEFVTNFSIDLHLARLLRFSEERKEKLGRGSWMLDVIMAPHIGEEACALLSSNSRRKLFANPALAHPRLRTQRMAARPVRGGLMTQPPADYVVELPRLAWTHPPAEGRTIDYLLAWAVAFTSNCGGNEIALARDGALLGGVGGGPSTLDAVHGSLYHACEQHHDIAGAVFGADAFFPFTDAPQRLLEAGCAGGTVPAGGKGFQTIKEFFTENGLSVGFIPAEYRGFCRK